jgi:hypothetical protein
MRFPFNQVYPMNPNKVIRTKVREITDLPNIGQSMASSLLQLGIAKPGDLVNRCPYEMYEQLCNLTSTRQDPCVLDVFISITRFMAGDPPQPWWFFTPERKRHQQQSLLKGSFEK